MRSTASPRFWNLFDDLPPRIQQVARAKHLLFLADPTHSGFGFKETLPGIYSVRINMQYRALGSRRGDLINWFWIGPHAEYDRILRNR